MRALILAFITVASSHATAYETLDEAISALWNGISHAPNQPSDVESLDKLFHRNGVIFGSSYKEGLSSLSQSSKKDFIAALATVRESGFYECEIERNITRYDRFAHVYSVVESRTEKTAVKADFTGVNSMQFYQTDQGWQILSLYYQVEKQDLPVVSKNAGQCLNAD